MKEARIAEFEVGVHFDSGTAFDSHDFNFDFELCPRDNRRRNSMVAVPDAAKPYRDRTSLRVSRNRTGLDSRQPPSPPLDRTIRGDFQHGSLALRYTHTV